MNMTFLLERMCKKSNVERIRVLQIPPLSTQHGFFFLFLKITNDGAHDLNNMYIFSLIIK